MRALSVSSGFGRIAPPWGEQEIDILSKLAFARTVFKFCKCFEPTNGYVLLFVHLTPPGKCPLK